MAASFQLRDAQSPDTWGSLSENELAWAMRFGQMVDWSQYQKLRKWYRRDDATGYGRVSLALARLNRRRNDRALLPA